MQPHHDIMLCQPGPGGSCAACCGLYNWGDHSRPAITAIVDLQTRLFQDCRSAADFPALRRERDRRVENTKLFETIYNCEFAGYIDPAHQRVGCMLHPAVCGDEHLRDFCFYGTEICNSHFCPGFSCLSLAEQTAVVENVHDWYLYGLVITDIDLVKEFFRLAENRLGESVKPARLRAPDLQAPLRDYFALKEHWPCKARTGRLGKYYFSRSEYNIARIAYAEKWGVPVSPWDRVLVSLESELDTEADLRAAEGVLDSILDRFVHAYSAAASTAAQVTGGS